MNPHRHLAWLLPLVAACDGDKPKVDENGCWLDREEAYMAVLRTSCETIACDPDPDSSETVESCMEYALQLLEERREQMCFDGCTVEECLRRLAEYTETCSDESLYDDCLDKTFCDGLEKECVTRPV